MADHPIDIAIEVGAPGWPDEAALEALAERTVAAAADLLAAEAGQPFPAERTELSLVFTDDAAVKAINAEWRGQDKPTNVLSFPAMPVRPGVMPGLLLGDIVLARETIAREADAMGIPFEDHLTHLVVHGFLHLLGHDHMEDDEAELMEGLETRILAALGLSDPYADTDPA